MEQQTTIHLATTHKTRQRTTVWVKAKLDGTGCYTLLVQGGAKQKPNRSHTRMALMESGAVMASFPINKQDSSSPGSIWLYLEAPALLPAGLFGRDITIAPGPHPMAHVMGKTIVMFRPLEKTT